MKRIIVTGHRGAAGLEPENTLRSFNRACALGVDRVETDVHLTLDGLLVCIHDSTLDRTTNGSGPVSEKTAAEIKALDAGEGESVPLLQEAIGIVRGRAVLQIELKGEGTVRPTLRMLEEAGLEPDEVLLSGFKTDHLLEVRSLRPDLPVSHLFGNPPTDAVEIAQRVGAESIAVGQRFITPEWVEAAHRAGLEIRSYNPDVREEMERLLEMGVDGLGSNRPDLLLDLLRETGAR
jgi:glycerophosphoryl diester phosphodiesterase